MPRFRILHISDFHFCTQPNRLHWLDLFRQPPSVTSEHFSTDDLSTYPSSYSDDIAENAARFISEIRPIPDLTLISGDLATTGLGRDLRVAQDYVCSPITSEYVNARGRPTISREARRIFVVPGNHDRYKDNKGNARSKSFEFWFDTYWPGPSVLYRVIGPRTSPLAIVAADFSLQKNRDARPPRRKNRYGQGRVHGETLHLLEQTTAQLREKYPAAAVIWMTHFPPAVRCPEYMRLLGDHVLLNAARKNSVSVILSGHLHERLEHKTRNGVQVICAGSMTSCASHGNHWIHLLEVVTEESKVKSCTRMDYRWDDVEDDFLPVPEKIITIEGIVTTV